MQQAFSVGYITDYAVLATIPPANLGPAELRTEAGVPGRPLR